MTFVSIVVAIYSRFYSKSLSTLQTHLPNAAEIILLVDQSGSMNLYDPRFAAKTYLVTFVKSFEKPHRIVLAGFDETIRVYLDRVVTHDSNADALLNELDAVPLGYVTDLEKPFEYLLGRTDLQTVQMVLLVTDGQPEIWDSKLQHLSNTVKADSRYQDLNTQNRSLQESGLSAQERYTKLGQSYQKRNLEFIDARVASLKKTLGQKFMIWDISGNSEYLRRWSEMAGATYVPIAVDSGRPEFQSALASAIRVLQQKTGVIIKETISKVDKEEFQAIDKYFSDFAREEKVLVEKDIKKFLEQRIAGVFKTIDK